MSPGAFEGRPVCAPDDTTQKYRERRFVLALIAITAIGLSIRVGFVLAQHWDQRLWGDAFFYHHQARGLARGYGFAEFVPACPKNAAQTVNCTARYIRQSADHPPLYTLFLALLNSLGVSSANGHLVMGAVVGSSTTIFVGLAGRLLSGRRVGLVAALIAALYANIWLHDGIGQSESLAIVACAAIAWLLMVVYRRPSVRNAALLGVVGGLGALTRAELLLVLPLAVGPLVMRLSGASARLKVSLVAACGLSMIGVVSPWLYRNMTAFEHPLYMSGGDGITMAAVSCDGVFYDRMKLGWWSPECITGWGPPPSADASERNEIYRDAAIKYTSAHTSRFPIVLAARVGRMWGAYRPGNPLDPPKPGDTFMYVSLFEGQTVAAARIGMIQYYLLLPLAAFGASLTWRRRRPVWIFIVPAVTSTLAAALTFGNLRYRAPAEVSIVIFAAVGVVWLCELLARRFAFQGKLLGEAANTGVEPG